MLRLMSAVLLGSALLGGVAAPSTAQAGQWQSQNGVSYYRGDDGQWYYYDSAGNCFVWDGTAWVPCAPPDGGYVAPSYGDNYFDYGYSPDVYGYTPYAYGYSPYAYGYWPYRRNHVYVAPFAHNHITHFPSHIHTVVPGHIHGGHVSIGHFHSGVGHGHVGHGHHR